MELGRVTGQCSVPDLIDCSLKKIFRTGNDSSCSPDIGTVLQELDLPCLSMDQVCSLDRSFSASEIQQAMFGWGLDKSPVRMALPRNFLFPIGVRWVLLWLIVCNISFRQGTC